MPRPAPMEEATLWCGSPSLQVSAQCLGDRCPQAAVTLHTLRAAHRGNGSGVLEGPKGPCFTLRHRSLSSIPHVSSTRV
jgi:hypothetical protein